MKEIVITKELQQLRIDKVCHKVFTDVPNSFLYKMFRKKNIVLNDKKIIGSEIVKLGDRITFYFSDDSFEKLSSKQEAHEAIKDNSLINSSVKDSVDLRLLDPKLVLFENEDLLVYNKPYGILSQPNGKDVSLIQLYENSLKHQTVSYIADTYGVCNRLDRNTTGVSIIGKHAGVLKQINNAIKNKHVRKLYHGVVCGILNEPITLEGFLQKDPTMNQVKISTSPIDGYERIYTEIRPTCSSTEHGLTMVEVILHTGKTHQIRAHLASIGYPILGDPKYGNMELNKKFEKMYNLKYQLLHSYSYTFYEMDKPYDYLNQKAFVAPYFETMDKIVQLIDISKR